MSIIYIVNKVTAVPCKVAGWFIP